MEFKQYPSYKPSGVEWLGDVPEHWNLKRFGYLFDENKKKNIGLKETNVLSLSYGNIKEKNIDEVLIYATKNVYKVDSTDVVAKIPLKNIENPQVYNSISKYVIKTNCQLVFRRY